MARVKKFTNEAVVNLLRHNDRTILGNSNADIDPKRTELNYSIPMPWHNGLSDYKYYKNLIDSSYIYGRGTQREKDIITACSWVVTAPEEIVGNTEKEKDFFKGVFDFIAARYGKESIINNIAHYDEAGSPHLHVIFCPRVEIDHAKIQNKTYKSKVAKQLDSGRWEFETKLKLDENGEPIPLKNYAKISDYYDQKLSAAELLNKVELQHFHQELQMYLDSKNIEGKVTNKATGFNISTQKLKAFTRKTDLKLNDVKALIKDAAKIESFINHALQMDEEIIKSIPIEERIQTLEKEFDDSKEIKKLKEEIIEKDTTIKDIKQEVKELKEELEKAKEKVEELTKEKELEVTKDQTWNKSNNWNSNNNSWNKSKEKENEVLW